MTLAQIILKWDDSYRYDFWWRQKHNIPFNSKQHREANQFNIAFEYFENHLANKATEQFKHDEERRREYEKSGQWMKIDTKIEQEIFDKIDLDSFNDKGE